MANLAFDKEFPPKRARGKVPGFMSPPTPEPPRPPAKSTSPRSRLFRARSPPLEMVRSKDKRKPLRSPHYDPNKNDSYFEQCFETIDELGKGSYGKVFKVRSRDDGKLYAVKKSTRKFTSRQDRRRRLEEVRSGRGLGNNPFCLQYYEAWEENEILFIQMELCQQGSLKDHALKHHIEEDQLWDYLASIIVGLDHIHSQNFLHLDIKPGNILIADDKLIKIADFGIAQRFRRRTGDTTSGDEDGGSGAVMDDFEDGDPVYMAPELLLEEQEFGPSADVFSAGMSLLDLASGRDLPGYGPNWHKLRKGCVPLQLFDGVSTDFSELILSMIRGEPKSRPTTAEILAHPKVASIVRQYQLQRVLTWPIRSFTTLAQYVLGWVTTLWKFSSGYLWTSPPDYYGSAQGQPKASSIGSSSDEDYDGGHPSYELLDPMSTGSQTRLVFDDDADDAPPSLNLRRRLHGGDAGNGGIRTRNLAKDFDDLEEADNEGA